MTDNGQPGYNHVKTDPVAALLSEVDDSHPSLIKRLCPDGSVPGIMPAREL